MKKKTTKPDFLILTLLNFTIVHFLVRKKGRDYFQAMVGHLGQQQCQLRFFFSDVITTNDLARKRTFDSRIRLAKKDFGDLAKKWDSRIRLAKKWDNRIRLAKRYMDWDKRIRLAKRSWDSRIRLAKRDGLGLGMQIFQSIFYIPNCLRFL